MKNKIKPTKRVLSIVLCLTMLFIHLPMTAFASVGETITVGDFTITTTDSSSGLTENTDYTYADGKLTITTDVPVTVGMKDGVSKTDEVIVTDSTNGEVSVTFDDINIETVEDAAITVNGTSKTTLDFSGTNNITSAETGIDVSNKTPLKLTSTDNGKLNISNVKYGIACIAYSASEALEIMGNINIDISGCTTHAIYYREGAVSVSGTPVINIDTVEYAIYGIGIAVSGGRITVKNDDGYAICGGDGSNITLSGQSVVHITEGDRGLRTSDGKITVTDSAKLKVYGGDDNNKTAAIVDLAISSKELLVDKNAVIDVFTKEDAISGGITKISNNAQVNIKINCESTYSQNSFAFNSTLDILENAKVNIDISGSKVYGLYDITDGTVNISDNAIVNIKGAYRSVYADYLNLSGKASLTIENDLNYAIYGVTNIKDSARLTATSTDKKVLYDEFTIKPADGKAYMVKVGASAAEASTEYYTAETTVSEKSTWRYFHAEPIDSVPINVSFDANGGEAIDPITVNHGEKYGRLPSSAVTGLSGGDSNWYLVDENGNVTDTKITRTTVVSATEDHKLFVKRQVLAPTLKITLRVPGAISDGYQYYVPENSQRILTVTVNNQNTAILDYTYQWLKDGNPIENATEAQLVLDGNVSDSGVYTVVVTAKLKDGTGIVVTSDTASAQKDQNVKIMHAANTLYYDANGGEGGPSSNYTGGTTLTVSSDEPTRDGYVFGGWNTMADGTGTDYSGGSTYTFAEDNGNGGCGVILYAKWIKAYDIYIGSVRITDANKDDVLGDGTVSYDDESNLLTLNGIDITDSYQYGQNGLIGIFSRGDLDIEVVGDENKVTAPDVSDLYFSYGIVVLGNLNISGDGSLTVNGGSVTSENIAASAGILVEGNFNIIEANVTANGGDTVSDNNYGSTCGVYVRNGLSLDFGATLTAIGGKAQGSSAYSSGVEASDGEEDINVSVYDGYLKAVGGDANGEEYANTIGVYVSGGGFYMYENGAKAVITAGKATTTAEEEDDPYAYSNGIYVNGGDVGIDAGSLDVSSGSYSSVDGDAYAIYIDKEEVTDEYGTYTMGGHLDINCDELTLSDDGFSLSGTTVTITSSTAETVHVDEGIEIGDKLFISIPENGEVSGIADSDDPNKIEYWTFHDADGNDPQTVTIKPLIYTVTVNGLSDDITVEVPADESINDTYCEYHWVEDFSELLDTEKDGYTFGGWYTDEACTEGKEFKFDTPVTEDITIYAKWVAIVYANTVQKPEGGKVTVSPESAANGETVVITPQPDNGKEVDTVTVTDKDGKAVTVTKNADGTYSFTQPAGEVSVKVTYKAKQTATDDNKSDNKDNSTQSNNSNTQEKDDADTSGTPQTGDNSNIALWFALLLVSGGAVFGITLYSKKRKTE